MPEKVIKLNRSSSRSYFIKELATIIRFTPREIDVLRELLQEKTFSECAQTLGLSLRTIETYVSKLKRKLFCHTRDELLNKIKNNHIFSEQSSSV